MYQWDLKVSEFQKKDPSKKSVARAEVLPKVRAEWNVLKANSVQC